tara:strand:+ start:560 stop:1156 length:597 start_codon:yes stop_codon:yes gene_type:complete
MSILKLNNRSVKDVTAFGSISSLGSLAHISTQTASSSASLNFTSGIDSTYKEYIFYFVNMHPETNTAIFQVGFRDGGSNFDAIKTSTYFYATHKEDDSQALIAYESSYDQSQSTSFQNLNNTGNENSESITGYLHLFNPSSTFVKHYITRFVSEGASEQMSDSFVSGYCNTTTAIDGVSFKFSTGNVDSGQILLFGFN